MFKRSLVFKRKPSLNAFLVLLAVCMLSLFWYLQNESTKHQQRNEEKQQRIFKLEKEKGMQEDIRKRDQEQLDKLAIEQNKVKEQLEAKKKLDEEHRVQLEKQDEKRREAELNDAGESNQQQDQREAERKQWEAKEAAMIDQQQQEAEAKAAKSAKPAEHVKYKQLPDMEETIFAPIKDVLMEEEKHIEVELPIEEPKPRRRDEADRPVESFGFATNKYELIRQAELDVMKEFSERGTEGGTKGRGNYHSQYEDLQTLHDGELKYVKKGGRIGSRDPNPEHKVAIVIPVKDMSNQDVVDDLSILLRNLFPILAKRGDLHARVFVVEQTDSGPFNPAKLFNIGFREAMKTFQFTCMVFHPPNVVPTNDNIPMGCQATPMQLVSNIENGAFTAPFARALVMTPDEFRSVNGYPESFSGLYGAGHSMYERVKWAGLQWRRPRKDIGTYHALNQVFHRLRVEKDAYDHSVKQALWAIETNGLKGMKDYSLWKTKSKALFTHVTVNLEGKFLHDEN